MVRRLDAVRRLARLQKVSWNDLALTVGPILLITLLAICAAYWFVRPAPPDTITIISGPDGSTFRATAEKYRKILARNGVKLKILPSDGSLDNLRKLSNPSLHHIDVGFVQGGLVQDASQEKLFSLGSVFHEPVAIFYRSDKPVTLLSEFAGRTLAIGPEGSGTRVLSLTLLKANGIEPGGKTNLLPLGGGDAAQALLDHKVDAAFLMGDSATPPVMRRLLWTPGIRLYSFSQADGYTRRYGYLNKLQVPMGAFDFGKNVPPQDMYLVAPTVELLARKNLHPALSDLLIEAAREVHGKATLMQKAGEFPSPQEREYPISPDARRYYTSGKSFLYRNLPFWLASLVDRTLVVFVPIVVLLIPGLKMVPALYNWRVTSRIYRWYGLLIALERSAMEQPDIEERKNLMKRLDDIEGSVDRMKIPVSFANQFYVLREHIGFVRERLKANAEEGKSAPG
ncbi:ABC transporter substrate-binding protein [Geomonas sp. Red875]|uniref:ABC transporter substrate-binding protein n=2 Tax=Geomesophilobacter sediminis TaxID=2798584 RepID=A0A8J7JJY2_9BACT|nr:ABC transporter substrate-binding protein [Geomesophilobacter sediminis]